MQLRPHIWIIAALCCVAGCNCHDDHYGWEFEEEFDADAAPEADADVGPDLAVDFALPSPDAGWVPEEIESSVPLTHALNERTSLAVDSAGTIWLGYHSCTTRNCDRVDLTLARKARGRDWTFERVKEQRGTFGVAVAQPEEPVAAFLDPTDNTFKVARRLGVGSFEFRALGVRRTGPSDGLDLTPDGDRMFVTFANDRGDPVDAFVLSQARWSPLPKLPIGDASAAYERGLASDGQGNLYLVHRRGGFGNPWGVARFSLADGQWGTRTYYEENPTPRPSSMVVTRDREVCIAGDVDNSSLTLTCGDMNDLERKRWVFRDERVALGAGGYSSLVEGTDGDLYVVYPANGNTRMRLGKKAYGDEEWEFETVFEKNAYGVSTVIDHDQLLVISYYTCGLQNCSLEVLSRVQP